MEPNEITEEWSLQLFLELREEALEDHNYRIHIQRLPLSDEIKLALIHDWSRKGWIVPAPFQQGLSSSMSWVLAPDYRGYPPGVPHLLTADELYKAVNAIKQCVRSDWSIKATAFYDLAGREMYHRLREADIIVKVVLPSGPKYVLYEELRHG